MDRWVGKIAVVTGASSGIGSAIALQLVEAGLQVVGLARRVEMVEAKANEWKNKKGKLIPYKADVSSEEQVIKAFKWIKENVGNVSILINNAGVSNENTLIDGDSEKWRVTFSVNVFGLCYATREAVKQMRDGAINGHIVHLNSIAGHAVPHFPKMSVYPASKHAVTALTESLRQELNENHLKIKVTSVSPGLVETEMTVTNQGWTEEKRNLVKQQPMLYAKDVANCVIYALGTPEHVQVHEITIKPLGEVF